MSANDETVPVSELMERDDYAEAIARINRESEAGRNPFRDIPAQPAKDEETAPLRLDVSISIFIAVWVGVVASDIIDAAPNSHLIVWLGAIIAAQLLIKWTRKR